jgi:tetratricopeptide (TPR) repeat protein
MGKRGAGRIWILGAIVLAPVTLLNQLSALHHPPLCAVPVVQQGANASGADSAQTAARESEQAAPITIDYPQNGSIFPPDIIAPTFYWRDPAGATSWQIEVAFSDGSATLRRKAQGERWRMGEIDQRCVAATNELPRPTPEQAVARTWKPDDATWEAIRKHTLGHPATVTIRGFRDGKLDEAVSRGQIRIMTSKDPVGAPIFFRDVPLIPAKTEKGLIAPIPHVAVPLVAWRLRYINEPKSHLILDGLPMCANCHSFSRDGKTLGMDMDGPENDKGLYTLASVQPHMSIRNEDLISWSALRSAPDSKMRTGFMSQVSPDGKFVITMMKPRVEDIADSIYTANFTDYHYVQVFYPTRGGLVWYSRATGELHDLPGADDPRYVQTDGVWSPDGQYVVFARAEAREPYPEGKKLAEFPNDPNETQIRYDLYRIPFNEGKGGRPEIIPGASENGKSNTFPKISPDGRWIVFVECRNGQLMRPDSQLYIIPAQGGEARRMRCNLPIMNSWHSFSPNGRWLVFSSKSPSPYTQMYLTHLDEEGNDSPAILIENATAANRAVNIPEFLNIPPGGLVKIDVPAAEFYRQYEHAYDLASKGENEEAIAEWKKVLEIDPGSAKANNNLGAVLSRVGRVDEAIAYFQKAVDLSPQLWGAQNDLAVALWEKGRLEEAIRHMERSLEISPVSAQIYETFVSEPQGRTDVPQAAGETSVLPGGANADSHHAENPEPKNEKLEAEYRRRLDALMASILGLSSSPLRLEDVPLGATSPPGAPLAPNGTSPPADIFPRIDETSPESVAIGSQIAGLEIPRLWKIVAQHKDDGSVGAAQRQILRIFLHSFEIGNLLLAQKRYAQASLCFDVAARASQENPYLLYSQARALALDRQKDRALKTLQEAVESGFNDAARVTNDQAFDGIRDSSDYRKALTQMRPPGS